MKHTSLAPFVLAALLLSPVAWGQGENPTGLGQFQGNAGTSIGAVDIVAIANFAPTGEEFSIRQDDPYTGSSIRQRVVTSSLPLNKPWSELTAQQQAVVRALYDKIPVDQEPPFPRDGLHGVYKPISDLIELYARGGRTTVTGRLDLGVIVGADGKVDSIAVHETPDRDLASAMGQVLFNVPFKPGKCAGKPCQMEFPVDLTIAHRGQGR